VERNFSIHKSLDDGMIECVYSLNTVAEKNTRRGASIHYKHLEAYYFIDGDLSFSVEGVSVPIKAGDMLLISNGILHRTIINRTSRYERRHILFNYDLLRSAPAPLGRLYHRISEKKVLTVDSDTVKEHGLDILFSEIEEAVESGKEECAAAALIYFSASVDRFGKEHSHILGKGADGRITAVTRYIDQHIGEPLGYEKISAQCYIAKKSLYRIFKREMGIPLGDYVTERRIATAKLLISTGVSAADAAYSVGYKDYSVFYRSFKTRVGMSPTEYIKMQGK